MARRNRSGQTRAEEVLWQSLRGGLLQGVKFRRQHAIDRSIVDFYAPKARLVIEVDGSSHETTHEADSFREGILRGRGLMVIRFTNDDVLSNLAVVLERIESSLRISLSDSPSPPGGEAAGG